MFGPEVAGSADSMKSQLSDGKLFNDAFVSLGGGGCGLYGSVWGLGVGTSSFGPCKKSLLHFTRNLAGAMLKGLNSCSLLVSSIEYATFGGCNGSFPFEAVLPRRCSARPFGWECQSHPDEGHQPEFALKMRHLFEGRLYP